MVGSVTELVEVDEEPNGNVPADQMMEDPKKKTCAVIKTSSRLTIFLPEIGCIKAEDLKPGDLVGVNKDTYLILEQLPPEYDPRVKIMEVGGID